MNAKWTPGPWKIHSQGIEGNTGYWHFDIRSNDWHIVEDTVGVLGRTYAELEANTRLIALAPEMAEVLRYFAQLGIETCSRCGGDGKASQANEACGQCGGTGKDTHNPEPSEIERARALLARLEVEK